MTTKSTRLAFSPHIVRRLAAPRVRSMAQTAAIAAIAAMVMWLAT